MKPRMEEALNEWLDDGLAAPEEAALQQMLIDDPEGRKAFYELVMMDQLLDERFREDSAVPTDGPVIVPLATPAPVPSPATGRGRIHAAYLSAAGIAALAMFMFFRQTGSPQQEPVQGPVISGSIDSRMTIAQRQERSRWEVGELLRIERGSANVKLAKTVVANFEGPAAIELVNKDGDIRLLEGMASFQVASGSNRFEVHVPGAVISDTGSRFTSEVFGDGTANLRVESGFLEVTPRGKTTLTYLRTGDTIRIDPDGQTAPIRLPNQRFREGFPEQVVLFEDNFKSDEGLPVALHRPQIGKEWKIVSEANPTLLHNQTLDTTSGARRVDAFLADHPYTGPDAVYIMTFHLVPPAMIADKTLRQRGYESITLNDAAGNPCLSIFAEAGNGHRWQLRDETSKAATALTQVCSIWTHSLTLCYGLDGRATLHDGATAQAPIIAEQRVMVPVPIASIRITNRDGGDLAFTDITASVLPDTPVETP